MHLFSDSVTITKRRGVHQYFLLVSKRVPGIKKYILNLYKLLIKAYSMSIWLDAAGEVHRYWQSSRGGGFPIPS